MSTEKTFKPQAVTALGQGIEAGNGRWTFAGTSESFEDHIERSVPGYRDGHDLIARLSDWFLYDGALALEIGCSTGALTRRIADWQSGKSVRFQGIEIDAGMVETARKRAEGFPNVEIVQGDALTVDLEKADLITSYYTMQFLRPAKRQEMFDRIYETLNWGGAFIMFEKVRGPDARFQDLLSTLYADFKLEQGFNEAEIVGKTRSLKGVLEPFSTQGNLDLLERAGFKDVMVVWKQLCFEGFLAIK
ncbi:MAG: methyltransferase domain-containing protein [Pseudomonadota bacterium]